MLQAKLHLISTIAIFSAAIIPTYVSVKIKIGNKLRIRTITITLAVFIMIHGLYHALSFLVTLLSQRLFEPLSVMVLIFFAVLMIKILYPNSLPISSKQEGEH